MKLKRKYAKAVLLAVVTIISLPILLIATSQHVSAAVRKPTPTIKPTATPLTTATPTLEAGTKLGGMNLDGYCNSINQPGVRLNNNIWYCGNSTTAITMSTACQWQYNTSNAVAKQDTQGNPYTWSCYNSNSSLATPTPTQIQSGPTPTTNPVLTATPTPIQTTLTPTPTQNGSYYLALGDSFAFGFHQAQFQQEQASNSYNPASFNDGYDVDFFHNLQGVFSGIQEINYACPGETAVSFVSGGCIGHTASLPLHTNYPVSQSQLQATTSFLQSHSGSVNTITLNIGVNEAINLATTCQAQANPVQCYSANTSNILATIQQNYDTILTALRQVAPQSNIIIVKSPNPVYYDGTDNLVNGLNQIQDNEASSRGLREADTFSIFNSSNICSYTDFCISPSDFHPTALGYSAMAAQIWSASGYAK